MAIEISEDGGVRSLHFGTPWVQGSMRIARPWSLELEYTRDMMFPLLLHPPAEWPRKVLMVGLGSGSMLKFLHRQRPHCRITAIEIDPAVIEAAHAYFRVPRSDPRIAIVCADGYEWLPQDRDTYDLILTDAFDRHARAHRLESVTFYTAVGARLAPEGSLACNLLTLHRSQHATRRALAQVFGEGLRWLPPCEAGNVVALATREAAGALDLPELRCAAAILRKQTQLNLLPLLSRIERT